MKKTIFSFLVVLALIIVASPAFALNCKQSQSGLSDECWTQVKIAANETTLVSAGTVLVYDFSSNNGVTDTAAYQVRVATASAAGVYVAGVAQQSHASGDQALIQVRGKGTVMIKTVETIASGGAMFVSTSGDASVQSTSTTQNQLGFALEPYTASGNSFDTIDAYITIV